MPGLRDTLANLAHARQRLDKILHAATAAPTERPTGGNISRLVQTAAFGDNPGNLRMLAYVPPDLPTGAPLVVALHGCTQTPAAYDQGSGWSKLAEQQKFAVLLPEQQPANNPNRCFNWFSPADTSRGQGEASSIHAMIERMIADHGIDRNRVFVVGLSAGGAMASAMLAAYPEVFAGGAVIAGLPHGSADSVHGALEAMSQPSDRSAAVWGELVRRASPHHRGRWPKVTVWHGSADMIVNPGNGRSIAKQWVDVHGLPEDAETEQVGHHARRFWRDAVGAVVVEEYSIAGMGHGVPLAQVGGIGRAGAFHLEVGLSSTLEIAKFWGLASARTEAAQHQAKPRQNETSQPADKAFDVRDLITETLRKAGVLAPAGKAANAHSIIETTLRSVGLLKK